MMMALVSFVSKRGRTGMKDFEDPADVSVTAPAAPVISRHEKSVKNPADCDLLCFAFAFHAASGVSHGDTEIPE